VAALGVPRRQHHTSSRGDIEPNTSGPADTHGQARVERYRTPGTSEPPEPRDLAPHTPRRGGRANVIVCGNVAALETGLTG
jgi:hypothetical protein